MTMAKENELAQILRESLKKGLYHDFSNIIKDVQNSKYESFINGIRLALDNPDIAKAILSIPFEELTKI